MYLFRLNHGSNWWGDDNEACAAVIHYEIGVKSSPNGHGQLL